MADHSEHMTTPDPSPEREGLFWIVAHEPGMVPERKGPWKHPETVRILREFIAARPTAYLHVLTIDSFGHPQIDHGPEVMQMLDGRSMGTGRKHNARTKAAHLASLSTPARLTREEGFRVGIEAAAKHLDERAEQWRKSVIGATPMQAMAQTRYAEELERDAGAIRSLGAEV